jgi:NAD(P)-dependent dehydrogenase (short-subunit alcohol dehydrogenase family)
MGMIDGKVAILTGSGRGIGAATAKMFGSEGASVVVSDLDPTPAEETAAAIRNAGGKAVVVAGDVTDPAFPAQLIRATLDSFESPFFRGRRVTIKDFAGECEIDCNVASEGTRKRMPLLYTNALAKPPDRVEHP